MGLVFLEEQTLLQYLSWNLLVYAKKNAKKMTNALILFGYTKMAGINVGLRKDPLQKRAMAEELVDRRNAQVKFGILLTTLH